MRVAVICSLILLASNTLTAKDDEPATAADAIAAAIAVLEAKVDEAPAKEQERIRKAIQQLEAILQDDAKQVAVDPLSFDVKPAVLKKKFKGRAVFEPKSGLLSLSYDFSRKDQLKDFMFPEAKPIIANQTLLIDGSEKITHLAKFKAFTVKGLMGVKSMRKGGIASTNQSAFSLGGLNHDGIYLYAEGGKVLDKIVPTNLRSGVIPFQFSVSAIKTSAQYGNERLTQPTIKQDDIHQIVFDGGTEGYAFSEIVISGIPEPKWLQEFLEAK